ncbi:glycerophosphodiester phosphodiesterase family protein [Peribacillus sp. SCS-26]|uniref:glycerophosphodiester phosphodiesterase family protein n=1 Tax=Paraperibacillus marinus TaxID=3115295 RepID=UPI00390660FB
MFTHKKLSRMAPMLLALSLFLAMPSSPGSFQLASAESAPSLILQEDFNSLKEGTLPKGWKVLQGRAYTADGKLRLISEKSSQPARVLMPLGADGGDFVFEAEMTFRSAADQTRWASLMYRIQGGNYPYYQFAVRKGTSALNGTEFSMRNNKNKWSVPDTAFYKENVEPGRPYRLKIIARKNRVQQFINDQLVIDTDAGSALSTGDAGFQAAGATVDFDSVRISKFTGSLPSLEESRAFLPQEPSTHLISPPTLIADTAGRLSRDQASSALLRAELAGGRASANGRPLQEVLAQLKNKRIPVIQLEQKELEDKVIEELLASGTRDVHILSSNPDIIKDFSAKFPSARGGILYSRSTMNAWAAAELARTVHASAATVAVVPQELITPDVVYSLHTKSVTVWGRGANTEAEAHSLIHTGVDGIITEKPEVSAEAMDAYPENTMVQRPIVAAHRGVPSRAPENTMAGYRLAYELGADMIETDVQKTKDGELVLIHDDTVNRTTTGTGNVKDMTLKEIRELDAGIRYNTDYAGERVPTLSEFLREFKGKQVMLLLEIKQTGMEEQLLQEIADENMRDQVIVQSFSPESLTAINRLSPETPAGMLYTSAIPKTSTDKLKFAKKMIDYSSTFHVTLNASYGSLYPEFIQYMRQRGMLSMHWTFRAEEAFSEKLSQGLLVPITDYTQWLTGAPIRLETSAKPLTLKQGKSAAINVPARLSYRNGQSESITAQLYVKPGEQKIRISGNNITAISPGKVQVFLKHSFNMLGKEWNLVSEPFEVTVTE